ncbi:MAG: hypothetical protein H0X02_05070 [Nitrosomonas sp.]|nr:hypothetical protein [Nitrosomonas sp.]
MPTPEEQFKQWLDSKGGYVGKGAKADWWNNQKQGETNQQTMNNIFDPSNNSFSVGGGSSAEQAGRLEGLQRAKILTGQNPLQIGQDYQQAYGNIKKRTTSSDTGSELLRANKAGAVADARNQLQSQGVKGGAALGAVSQIERAKSYDVNNQLMQNQKQAESDYLNATKANANFTQASEMNFGQMAMGKDVKAPPSNSSGFGGMGTVICTELFKQGHYKLDIYAADQIYGLEMMQNKPHVYWGYRSWADHVVPLMQKSKAFTRCIAFVAVPWAENMAGKKNLVGKIISLIGEPICGIIGKSLFLISGDKNAIQKA